MEKLMADLRIEEFLKRYFPDHIYKAAKKANEKIIKMRYPSYHDIQDYLISLVPERHEELIEMEESSMMTPEKRKKIQKIRANKVKQISKGSCFLIY